VKSPLPIRNGVSASRQFLPTGHWRSILEYLEHAYPTVDTATWIDRMQRGEVLDEKGARIAPSDAYHAGSWLFYYRELQNEIVIPFEERILLHDEHLVVVDKPHFLPVIPTGPYLHQTLLVRLKRKLQLEHLTPIHRLDRETAGVMLFSHNPESRGTYQSMFQKHAMKKVYEALAPTSASHAFPFTYRSRIVAGEPFYRMKETDGDANSETHIEVLENRGEVSLYLLRPKTGRQHQLRVHLAALGIPILNDRFYPELAHGEGDNFARPLKLLARSISFEDPYSGLARSFRSERVL